MFKIGDIVTIKQLSACDKSCAIFNSIAMTKYQGTSHTSIETQLTLDLKHRMTTLSGFQMAQAGGG